MNRSKRYRLGPQLRRAAADASFFDAVHVLFGGTGAVGGATALQMIDLYEEAARDSAAAAGRSPHLVITGRSKAEVRQFTRLLFALQQRDHGRLPSHLEGLGYRTAGGVSVELTVLAVDPAVSGLEEFARKSAAARREALVRFLANGGLTPDSPKAARIGVLEQALRFRVGRPFSDFLRQYLAQRGSPLGGGGRFRSVLVGIPLASVAAYKLDDLEEAAVSLGVERGSEQMDEIKEIYLKGLCDDLAEVREHLADEVLAAHTTAVGGMYDEEEDGSRTIRLGFAHSAIDDKLRKKQIFAEELARLYAARNIKILITAAAIGVDAVLIRERPPMNPAIRSQLVRARDEGHSVLRPAIPPRLEVYPPVDLDLLSETSEPVYFEHGHDLVLDHVLKSGENGYFTVSNADALYRVMRVTTSSELGLLLARTALFGDDPHVPMFPGNTCYYTETDNSRQVFDFLGQPKLRQNQLSGLQPKALQDLGSAKHQAELHTLGLLILLHRLETLDLGSLEPHVELASFEPVAYFETHSPALSLEQVSRWTPESLAGRLRLLVAARKEKDLASLQHLYQPDANRQEAIHRILQAVLRAAWAVPSLGTPLIYEDRGRRRVVAGYYAAAVARILTHRDSLSTHLRRRFEDLGGGSEEEYRDFVEFHVANFGFADLRPVAVLVTAKSDERWRGNVQVFRDEASFVAALRLVEPYSYFTTSGLIALLVRLRGLYRLALELDPHLGTANEFRAHIPFDEHGRPLLVPGVVEAFRMVSEGLEKNTGAERLDGRWGYFLDPHT